MTDIGSFLIWLTLVTAAYAVVAGVLAARTQRADLTLSASYTLRYID